MDGSLPTFTAPGLSSTRSNENFLSSNPVSMPTTPIGGSVSPAGGYRPRGHTRSRSSISQRYTPIQFQAAFEAPHTEEEDDTQLESVDLNGTDETNPDGSPLSPTSTSANAFRLPLPPPPKAGEKFVPPMQPSAVAARRRTTMPAPMIIPPSMSSYYDNNGSNTNVNNITTPVTMPGLSTSRSTTPISAALPTPSPLLPPWSPASHSSAGRSHSHHSRSVSFEHPSGYIQDASAAELSSDQRRAREIMEERVRRESGSGSVFEAFSETMGLMGGKGGVSGNYGGDGIGNPGTTTGVVWGAAKRFSISASKTFEVVEKEAWRLVGGGKT